MSDVPCSWCELDLPRYMMREHDDLLLCPKCHSNFELLLSKARKKEPYEAPDLIAATVARIAGEESAKIKEQRTQALARAAEAKREAEERAERIKAEQEAFERQHQEALEQQAKEKTAKELARKELARRALASKHLLPFVKYHMPTYQAGWVHKDICRRLERFSEQVARGESPRLMIFMPPRSGKSLLSSQMFPAWHLGKYPTHDIITGSYSAALATDFSKKVRSIIKSREYLSVFPKGGIDPDNQNAEGWNTIKGGQYVPAGVGGPITGRGAHCLPLTAEVLTPEGPKALGSLINNCDEAQSVLTYDGTRIVEQRINAFLTREADGLYRIQTSAGPIEATGEHPLCVGFCPDTARPLYRRVDDLRPGDRLVGVDGQAATGAETLGSMPDVRRPVHQTQSEQIPAARGNWSAHMLQRVFRPLARFGQDSRAAVQFLREIVPGVGISGPAQGARGGNASFLHQRVLWGVPLTDLCGAGASPLCLGGVGVPPVRHDVPAPAVGSAGSPNQAPVLQPRMLCRMAAWSAYPAEFEDAWGKVLPIRVQASSQRGHGGQPTLCRVWPAGHGSAPQGRGPGEQRSKQFGTSMSGLSHPASCRRTDPVVESIEWIPGPVTVGDMEVDQSHSFLLSNGVLSRNCLILDDIVKNRDEAESDQIRESTYSWFTSTAYTRLAPGGGILLLMTRWHEDDLPGRLLTMSEMGEGDKWEVIRYPAIAIEDETYRKAGEALHPDRYPIHELERIKRAVGRRDWQALYQQDPIGDEGDFFQASTFQYYRPDERPPLEDLTVYASWDLAIGTKEHNDFTVGMVAGIDRSLNVWLLDQYRGKWGSLEIIDKMFECYDKWKPSITGIERTHVEQALGPLINEQKRQRRKYGMRIEPLKPGRRDKQARARPLQGLFEMGRVFIPQMAPWRDDFVNEMLKFPNGKHDDQVDSAAYLGQMIELFNPRPLPKPKPKKSWRDKLDKFVTSGSGTTSHMAS